MSNATLNRSSALTPEGISAQAVRFREPSFLTERRLRALNHYVSTPMPGRTDEIWRRVEFGNLDIEAATVREPFGDLMKLTSSTDNKTQGAFWAPIDQAMEQKRALLEEYWNSQVFPAGVDGPYGTGGKFHSLNQALWDCGYVCHVAKGVEVEIPLQAHFNTRAGNDGIFPHNLIVLEDGASATVIEFYNSVANSKGLCCPQTEIIMGKNAKLRYIVLQNTGPEVVYIGAHRAHQFEDSRLTNVSAHLGSRLAKTFIATKMLEPRAHAYLSALYYGTGKQKIHLDTLQHHVAPNCTTDLMFKGALDDKARAVYRGLIRLEPDAQKTDAYQQNRTLLLSDEARVDSIPGLEILANDVRCTHGATAGQIDPTILFYLMSRGLTKFEAQKMIMDGFFEEVILRFGLESITEPLRQQIDQKIRHEVVK